jgi:hypothetical protein
MDADQVMMLTRLVPPEDSVLEWALRKNVPWATLRALIEVHRCDPSARDASAFRTACRLGNNGAVRLFLAAHRLNPCLRPIDAGANDNVALRLARKCEHDDVIATLISLRSVDARIDDHELLAYAVAKDNVALVGALVTWTRTVGQTVQFVNPFANDALAVHMALKRNHPEIMHLVLLDWRPPEGASYTPRTALQQAILRAAASSSYVHDCLDAKWRLSPRLDTYMGSPRATIVAYYTSNEDDPEEEAPCASIPLGSDNHPLRKSTPRFSADTTEEETPQPHVNNE